MAEQVTGQISGVLGNLFSGSVTVLFWIFLIVIIMGGVGGIIWYFWVYRRKFDIEVKIFSQRHGEDREFYDKGAVLFDREANTRYLRLLETKIDLELPKFNVFRKTNRGDYLELRRTGERTFNFLTPPKIDSEYYVNSEGKKFNFAKAKQRVIESDITWILNRERKNKNIITPEGVLKVLLEHLPHVMTVIFFIFAMWMIFRYAPEFMNAMSNFVERVEATNRPNVVGSIMLIWGMTKWKN
jgi:hypothetical protein